MPSTLIALMQRSARWKLYTLISLALIVLTELIVSSMDYFLNGDVGNDTLVIGLVASAIVVPLGLVFIEYMLNELGRFAMQSASERAENRLLAAIEAARMVFWELDIANDRLIYDEATLRYLGIDTSEIARSVKSWLSLVHPDDQVNFSRHFMEAVAAGGPPFDFEYRFREKPGCWVWLHTSGRVIERGADGRAEWAAGGTVNVTERKQTELLLAQTKQTYYGIFNSLTEAIYVLDETFTFIEVNAGAEKMYQYSHDELVGKTPHSVAAPGLNDMDMIARQMAETSESGKTTKFEFWAVRKNGDIFPKEVIVNRGRFFDREVLIATARDITERKKADMELAASRQLLKSVIDTVPARVFWKDRESRYLGCNTAFAKDAGADSPEAMIGKDDFQFGWKDQANLYRADDRQVMESGIAKLSFDEPQTTPDGHTICLRTSKTPLRDDKGETIGLLGIYEDITSRKEAEDALRASEERAQNLASLLRLITDNVPDMIWAKDLNKRYLLANKAICEQLLNAADTAEPVGKDDMFFALRERGLHPGDPKWHTFGELCQDSDAITLQRGKPSQFDEYGNVRGRFMFLDVRKAPFLNERGEVVGVVGSARDVTEQKMTEERLRLASLVLHNSSEALLVSDAENRIVDINPAFTRVTGYTLDEVAGRNPSLLHSGRHDQAFYRKMWQLLESTGQWQGEIWNRRKSGEIYAEWLTINVIRHEDGTIHRFVALFSDITEKKKSEELIWSQANFDQLTGLPNRSMFHDRLAQGIKKAHRAGLKLALMFLDLDRFKEVNDTMGHGFGDALLAEAATRITACVRESDTVARLGGDEFTIILPELSDLSGVERIANEIISSMSRPFMLGDHAVYVSASIGITLYPDDAGDQESLLKNADQAMYVAKNAGRNRFSYFTSAMQESAQYRLHLLSDLRGAIAQQQLQLHYQPIQDLRTGKICKAEALLRWFHPTRGLISPAEFIPLAEESGLIHEIGDWVFAESARQAKRWLALWGDDFQVSVNKSPVQFQFQPSQCHWTRHLESSGLHGRNIVIEITEGLLLDTSMAVTSELLAFRDAGIQVAIDDFGTGYSALSYLNKLDIDYVKIDRSFIQNLSADSPDMALIEAVIVMAHKLGLQVVAEGVETRAQHELLAGIGCDFAQGYLYSHPVPAWEFERLPAENGQLWK